MSAHQRMPCFPGWNFLLIFLLNFLLNFFSGVEFSTRKQASGRTLQLPGVVLRHRYVFLFLFFIHFQPANRRMEAPRSCLAWSRGTGGCVWVWVGVCINVCTHTRHRYVVCVIERERESVCVCPCQCTHTHMHVCVCVCVNALDFRACVPARA
jgi:hypothetical protein